MRDWLVSVSLLPARREQFKVAAASSFDALSDVMRREMLVEALKRAPDGALVISVMEAKGGAVR